MATSTGGSSWVTRLALALAIFTWALGGLVIAYTVLAALSAWRAGPGLMTLAPFVLILLAEAGGLAGVVLLLGLVRVRVHSMTWLQRLNERLRRLETLLESAETNLRALADLAPLSDEAKSMIYRQRELEAVHEVIHECLAREDYHKAEQLITQIEQRFGSRAEAERFRSEVVASRQATRDEKIAAALARVEQIVSEGKWAWAAREADRLTKVFPESEKIRALSKRVSEAKSSLQRELLQSYSEAVKKNDVDRSIELLKQLDMYLSPQEAAALQDSARGVFRAKLHNLGVQFAIAVNDERWDQAVQTGEEIVREFPNTRMATEVREKLDQLRLRATSVGS